MTRYEVNPISREAIEEFRNELAEFDIDEDFLKIVFRILDSSKLSPKGKICFLDLVIIVLILILCMIQQFNLKFQ